MTFLSNESDVNQRLQSKSSIAIYGMGEYGKRFFDLCEKSGMKIYRFIDNNNDGIYKGVSAVKSSELSPDDTYVICNRLHFREIYDELLSNGVPENNIYVFLPMDSLLLEARDIKTKQDNALKHIDKRIGDANKRTGDANKRISDVNKRIGDANKRISDVNKRISDAHREINRRISDVESSIRKLMPLPLIQFETSIVDHCILNCKGCDHFSPIAKKWFADIEIYRKDMKQLAMIFGGEARYVRLLGGEPLLHPKITEFMKASREAFMNAYIDVWTNGLLLSKMSDNFWDCCRELDIVVHITKYPVDFDYDTAKEKAASCGVRLKFFGNGMPVTKFMNNSFNLDGMCEPANYFSCSCANRIITFSQGGNLYTCDKVSRVDLFNDYFGCNLKASDKDFINIYSETDADKILEFLSKPIPFCRYCNISKRNELFDWANSKRDISEWVE